MRLFLMAAVLALSPATAAQAASGGKSDAEAKPVAATAVSDDDKECRRNAITGSLVRKARVCKSRAEWRRLDAEGNDGARDIIDASRGRPSGQ